jgi:hypothetical protein
MTRLALPLIAISAALLVAPTASAKDLKAAHFGNRCWQPPVCPPHWNPCPPHWNPCPPQICPPHWNPCPPQWGIVPVPGQFPANGQAAFQNAAFRSNTFSSQRNAGGVDASSLFNR